MYFLAIDTTSLRFAAASCFLASWSQALIFFQSATSSSDEISSTLHISFRYILIESSLISDREIAHFHFFASFLSQNRLFLSRLSTISIFSFKNLIQISSSKSISSSS
jgi:hypothetical protein